MILRKGGYSKKKKKERGDILNTIFSLISTKYLYPVDYSFGDHCIFYTFYLDLDKALLAKEQSPKPWHVQKFFRSFTHFNASIYKIGVLCVQI